MGGLDRVLGALFGAVRGLVGIAVLYILYSMVVPVPAQAKWMTNARTLLLIQKSAGALLSLLPADDAKYVDRHTQRSVSTTTVSREDPPANSPVEAARPYTAINHHSAHKGYGAEDRRALNRLIETTGDSGNER